MDVREEASSALDTENEQRIVENLKKVPEGCAPIIAVPRLSTMGNADKSIVLDQERVCEQETHTGLVVKKAHLRVRPFLQKSRLC